MEILLLLLIIVGFAIAVGLGTPGAKGRAGERSVQIFTSIRLDGAVYRRIDDITLEHHGQTTQIDHVFVSQFGIFVVETKNMSGWIFGSENQAQWTQKLFKKTLRFQNPLRQNYRHVKTLEALLSIPAAQIHSVVVFVGDAEFKTPMPRNVTHKGGLVTFIRSFTTKVLTTQKVEELVGKIERARLPATKETARKHVENLRGRTRNLGVDQPCPRCGSRLVLRTSKNGAHSSNQFLGCTGYPKCRFTRAAT